MRCRLTRELDGVDGTRVPAGTVIDDPRAFRLVQQGVAAPLDAECAAKCEAYWRRKGLSVEEGMAVAAKAYERVVRGIHPDDYAAFDRGEMLGYQPDGSWIPGPNAVLVDDDEEECDIPEEAELAPEA